MATSSIRVSYRPVRVGWCVRPGNLTDLERALRLTHCLWGGRFNPVIPVANDDTARGLVRTFRVDCLYDVARAADVQSFIGRFPYLPWPDFEKEIFVGEQGPNFVDIYHSVDRLQAELAKIKQEEEVDVGTSAILYDWEPEDPVNLVLLSTFGAYPGPDETQLNYRLLVEKRLHATIIGVTLGAPVPTTGVGAISPSAVASYGLEADRVLRWPAFGLYLGSARNYEDLVAFWNLRAAGLHLIFYDPALADRLRPFRDHYIKLWKERMKGAPKGLGVEDALPVWSRAADSVTYLHDEGLPAVYLQSVEEGMWEGYDIRPLVMHLGAKSVLASVSDEGERASLSFELPEKPFISDFEFDREHVVVSIHPIGEVTPGEETTFSTPFLPELNEYYGRNSHFIRNTARAEADGLGIIEPITQGDLTVWALPKQELIARIFEVFGMKAEPSHAGRVATRLIQQMGGIQGCRVFKVAGVRKLIGAYGPLKPFTKSAAVQMIGENDPATGRPRFEKYEHLYIKGQRLRPQRAFDYLVERGVFRVGLELACPHCELDFWLALDDVSTTIECEYCGKRFNVTSQLHDRDWAYRRSGLFGREDHQEGSIPVALTLQQLDTTLHGVIGPRIFVTGTRVDGASTKIRQCESDFVIFLQDWEGRMQVAVGECKSAGGEITEDDVANLSSVADAFPSDRVESFLVFSKTGPFTPEEIARCRTAQPRFRFRVILLTDCELEPYFIYQDTSKEFDIRPTAISLDDLAQATQDIFFEPKVRKAAAGSPGS